MTAALSPSPVLAPECEKLLEQRDWYADASITPGFAVIRDEEGCRKFDVTTSIDAFNLSQLLRYADMQYRHGVAHGKNALQHQLRMLLNAAPLEPSE